MSSLLRLSKFFVIFAISVQSAWGAPLILKFWSPEHSGFKPQIEKTTEAETVEDLKAIPEGAYLVTHGSLPVLDVFLSTEESAARTWIRTLEPLLKNAEALNLYTATELRRVLTYPEADYQLTDPSLVPEKLENLRKFEAEKSTSVTIAKVVKVTDPYGNEGVEALPMNTFTVSQWPDTMLEDWIYRSEGAEPAPPLTVITEEQAKSFHREMLHRFVEKYENSTGSCQVIAHKTAILLGERGITSRKIYVFSPIDNRPLEEALVAKALIGGQIRRWYNHVGVVVRVQTQGREEDWVIDPTLHSEPISIRKWLANFGARKTKEELIVRVTTAYTFINSDLDGENSFDQPGISSQFLDLYLEDLATERTNELTDSWWTIIKGLF